MDGATNIMSITNQSSLRSHIPVRAKQSGVVLIISLIVLVAMMLAAIALIRMADTNNLIAGNMAFQQAATRSGDQGIETAFAWLQARSTGVTLDTSDSTGGYRADGAALGPNLTATPPQTWDAYWSATLAARAITAGQADAAGNTVSYVIDRLCRFALSRSSGADCVASPSADPNNAGSSQAAGLKPPDPPSVVYYRITVRIDGPRNTVSYVQSIVSM